MKQSPSPQQVSSSQPNSLDRAVYGVVLVLLLLLVFTLLLGDQVGVQLTQVAPLGNVASTRLIMLSFGEAMDQNSVAEHFHIVPSLEGSFSREGTSLVFRAKDKLIPGTTYTVSLEAGATSISGRKTLAEYRYTFTVRHPRIVYLAPADARPQNLWLFDPQIPDQRRQLTYSVNGISSFSVSPDGTQIAYSELYRGEPLNLKILNLDTGVTRDLFPCANAICSDPLWQPDGKMIAYIHIDLNRQFGSSRARLWLLDLAQSPATNRPLFEDSQILGHDPQWSADGSRIALVDQVTGSILVYQLATRHIVEVGQYSGTSGALSPDGSQLVYPQGLGSDRIVLYRITLDTGEIAMISDPNSSESDLRARWSPDGRQLLFARTSGLNQPEQLLLLDIHTNTSTVLIDDTRYTSMNFLVGPEWNAGAHAALPRL